MLGRRGWVESDMAWVAAALPLNDNEIPIKPAKFSPLVNPEDPVANQLGLRRPLAPIDLKAHDFSNYVDSVKSSMLFED
jgi:hypothetical protein